MMCLMCGKCVWLVCVQESERRSYNPRSFCKVYTMDHEPLNTSEQKDMTEFFTDLISKMEDMGPNLKVSLLSHNENNILVCP